eukprot:TCONS_00050903-protein
MERMSLLEKLKTLNQWQLQQQLHFAKLQSDVEAVSIPQNLSNKENLVIGRQQQQQQPADSIHQQHFEKPSQSNFMQTMNQNALTNALKSVNSNSLNTQPIHSNLMNENSLNSVDYEENLIDEKDEIAQAQTTNKGGGLDNWYLSGLQTVKFMSPSDCENLTEVENDDDVISDHEEENSCHDNQEDFSDLDDVVLQYESEDGVRPFSTDVSEDEHETLLRRDENSNHDLQDPFQRYLNVNSSKTQRLVPEASTVYTKNAHGGEQYNQGLPNRDNSALSRGGLYENEGDSTSEEENECTVIHNEEESAEDEIAANIDERPVKSMINGIGVTFENIVENELKNDMENVLNTSTPMKNKSHKFLKRGEGLKRFQKGNNAFIPTKEKEKNKNKKPAYHNKQPKNNKAVVMNIDPPPPNKASKTALVRKTRPGLPLKLKLKHRVQKEASTTVSNTVPQLQHLEKIADPVKATDTMDPKSTSQPVKTTTRHDHRDAVSSSVMEASFQKMLIQYTNKEEKENKDLDDFEALEEAAENMSLSSNCSFVHKVLGGKTKTVYQGEHLSALMVDGLQKFQEVGNMKSNSTVKKVTSISNNTQSEKQQDQQDDDEAKNSKDTERPKSSYDFDDESTWSDNSLNDGEDTSIFSAGECNNDTLRDTSDNENSPSHVFQETVPPKRIISKRKDRSVSQNTTTELEEGTVEPPSLLTQTVDIPTSSISNTVKQKLAELEKEIKTFRMENDKLAKLREQRETEVSKLHKEIESFQRERKAETERFESYQTEETKKLRAEKRAFEKFQKAAKAFPNKQEREETKELKQELERLKDELKTREARWNNASIRFRTRITDLEEENGELKKEIKIFEEQRIERWKNNHNNNKKPPRVQSPTDKALDKRESIFQDPSSIGVEMNERLSFSPLSAPLSTQPQMQPTLPQTKPQSLQQRNHESNETQNALTSGAMQHLKDGKTEVLHADGSKLITFPNGTKKTISADGKTISICFFNGDIKRLHPDQRVVYYYAETQTTHTTFKDGLEVLEFSNKQIEKRHTDGRTEIIFPDQTVKYVNPDGSEETVFVDGMVQNVDKTGVRTVLYPNGQREVHTNQFKRREYPNGTIKTVYEDGRQETKYSNGRLRVKDKDGNLVIDRLKP